jgi:hypothetical protein
VDSAQAMRRDVRQTCLTIGAAFAVVGAITVVTSATTTPARSEGATMSAIVTDLPACTEEDGSYAGQQFPCVWDSSAHGNGVGISYVLTGILDGTNQQVLPADTTALCSPGTELNLAGTACEVPVPAAAPLTLASTGLDPAGALTAVVLVAAGVALLTGRRLLRRA